MVNLVGPFSARGSWIGTSGQVPTGGGWEVGGTWVLRTRLMGAVWDSWCDLRGSSVVGPSRVQSGHGEGFTD